MVVAWFAILAVAGTPRAAAQSVGGLLVADPPAGYEISSQGPNGTLSPEQLTAFYSSTGVNADDPALREFLGQIHAAARTWGAVDGSGSAILLFVLELPSTSDAAGFAAGVVSGRDSTTAGDAAPSDARAVSLAPENARSVIVRRSSYVVLATGVSPPGTPIPGADLLGTVVAQEANVLPAASSSSTGSADGSSFAYQLGRALGVVLLIAGGALVVRAIVRNNRRSSPTTMAPASPPGWAPDPTSRHQLRWWDGAQWTAAVADDGLQSHDPV